MVISSNSTIVLVSIVEITTMLEAITMQAEADEMIFPTAIARKKIITDLQETAIRKEKDMIGTIMGMDAIILPETSFRDLAKILLQFQACRLSIKMASIAAVGTLINSQQVWL